MKPPSSTAYCASNTAPPRPLLNGRALDPYPLVGSSLLVDADRSKGVAGTDLDAVSPSIIPAGVVRIGTTLERARARLA